MECSLLAPSSETSELRWHHVTVREVEESAVASSSSQNSPGILAGEAVSHYPVVPTTATSLPTSSSNPTAPQNSLDSLKVRIADGKKLFADLEDEVHRLDGNIPAPGPPEHEVATLSTSDLAHAGPSDWLQDLQLIKHYLTTAYQSFCQDDRLAPLWRDVIPDCAFSHEFLMHGLLAVSALHFGHMNPAQEGTYALLSARHQAVALNWFSSQLHNINKESYKAHIFLGSIVFIFPVFAVADAGRVGRIVETHEIVQSFVLLKGAKSILDTPPAMEWAVAGELEPLVDVSIPTDTPATEEFVRRLAELKCTVHRIASERGDSAETLESCTDAIEALRNTYTRVVVPGVMADGVWLWPLLLRETFTTLLAEEHPLALVILGYFSALMRCFEVYWWSKGWSASVVEMIVQRLDAEWYEFVEWPVTCVREAVDVRDMHN